MGWLACAFQACSVPLEASLELPEALEGAERLAGGHPLLWCDYFCLQGSAQPHIAGTQRLTSILLPACSSSGCMRLYYAG